MAIVPIVSSITPLPEGIAVAVTFREELLPEQQDQATVIVILRDKGLLLPVLEEKAIQQAKDFLSRALE